MKKVLIVLLAISAVFFLISCGSKPAPEETPAEAPVVTESDAEESIETDVADSENDEEAYAALLAKIEDARNVAVEAGAEENAPELLEQIDNLFESLKGENLKDNADMLIARYNLLASYLKAQDAKDEIDENDFAFYAQSNYDEGVASLEKVEASFDSPDEINQSIYDEADKAYASFNTVLTVAYKRLAKEAREEAYAAKKRADSVKAGVSEKERYREAADDFQNGDSLYSMQSPKKAYEKYESARDLFDELYDEVFEKRAAAQAAIEAAKKRVAESAKYAEEADSKSPITETDVEGIEDEDAVLLEEDDYEDPEEAEVDIAETIDDDDEDYESDDEEDDDDDDYEDDDEDSEDENLEEEITETVVEEE